MASILIRVNGKLERSTLKAFCCKCNRRAMDYDERCYDGRVVYCKQCRKLQPVYIADKAMPEAI